MEATKNATRFLLNDKSKHPNQPLTQLLYRDPYQDLSNEDPPLQVGKSSRTFHHPIPDEDPIIKAYRVEHLALVEALGVVRVLEQNQEQDESTLLAIKTERDNAQVQLVNFRTSMMKNCLAHTTGRYPDHP